MKVIISLISIITSILIIIYAHDAEDWERVIGLLIGYLCFAIAIILIATQITLYILSFLPI